MSVPDAAVEAAAGALKERNWFGGSPSDLAVLANAALTAAVPAIREAIAQEIDNARELSGDRGEWVDGMHAAARIVRGGTP